MQLQVPKAIKNDKTKIVVLNLATQQQTLICINMAFLPNRDI